MIGYCGAIGRGQDIGNANFFETSCASSGSVFRSNDSETNNLIRITKSLMTKTILLLAAVVGLASGVYAADPSPSASASAKKTPHHGHHHKTAAPSASPSATR